MIGWYHVEAGCGDDGAPSPPYPRSRIDVNSARSSRFARLIAPAINGATSLLNPVPQRHARRRRAGRLPGVRRLRGLAYAAVIMSMIPCTGSCCYLNIGVGIWALVVLADDNVKASFT